MHTTHPEYTPTDWEDVFSGVTRPDSGKGFDLLDRPAHEQILHLLRLHEEDSVTIVAVGPLSTVARAAMTDPATFSRVQEIVVMGGCIDTVGNANPFAEFNTFADPEAAALVFALSNDPSRGVALPPIPSLDPSVRDTLGRALKITLLPLDMTRRHWILEAEWREGCRGGTVVADWLAVLCAHSFRVTPKNAMGEVEPFKGLVLHDALCIWYVVNRDDPAFGVETLDLRVETVGQWTRGMCCVDRRPKAAIPAGAKAVSSWVDPGSWMDDSVGNRVRVLTRTPGRREWAKDICRAVFGNDLL
jgi:inosine-uridine nucleoside N-ribohydrolase